MARPKGSRDTKPRQTAARKLAKISQDQGITPLEIMMAAAEFAWKWAQRLQSEVELEDADAAKRRASSQEIMGVLRIASEEAARAAPYIHPRLASETHRVLNDDNQRSPEDIRREIEELDRRAAVAVAPGAMAQDLPEQSSGVVH